MAQSDSVGPEALLKASSDCKFRLVRLLVDGGTSINVRNDAKETPLMLACKSDSTEKEKVVEFLIKHRVKMNLQDEHGKTALMYACLSNSSDKLVRMLVSAKANPWVKDASKNTAFDYAISAGNIGTVKVMIEACREGKILSKPGSFNMEMRQLEEKLEQLPEVRKCSWPLMGPRNSEHKEKKISQQSELLVVEEDDESESPTRERRRKKSICHFDPIDIGSDKKENEENTEALPRPLRKGSLYSVGRSFSEDEKISLHFSDSDNSSFDISTVHLSSLERLIKLQDSITSSLESNESLNASAMKLDAAWNTQKHKEASHIKEKSEMTLEGSETTRQNVYGGFDILEATGINADAGFDEINVKRKELCLNEAANAHEKQLVCSSVSLVKKTPSPSLRRKTLGSLGRRDDVIESNSTRTTGSDSAATRRITVSTMEVSGVFPYEMSSTETKINRMKIRPLEVDMNNAPFDKTKRKSSGSSKLKTSESFKVDSKPLNLPIISHPDQQEDGNELNGKKLAVKLIEKTSVRRTLSDSMCQSKRGGETIVTRSDNRLGVGCSSPFSRDSNTVTSQAHVGNRERSASSPLTPPSVKTTFLSTRSDGVLSSSSRCVSPRYTLAGDLPDLVLHSSMLSHSLAEPKHDLQVKTRLSPSPEVLDKDSVFRSNSFSNLPEVVNFTTRSPKEKRVALLPPLNISRKSTDAEEGYFSCSPSPLDLESPNRGKEKSKYSFKPLSPRLVNRPVRNALP